MTTPVHSSHPLPGVGAVIAVASGKGGVGKSTVASNLALALAKEGKRVGLLDLDIYGPSLPLMFGLLDAHPQADENGKIVPLKKFGLDLMSFGFFVQSQEAVVWRGPLVSRMVEQLIKDVKWGSLDCLIIDLPPGTGDAQLTLSQVLPLSGVVIVSTPQEVALIDAVKGVSMFQKVEVPILGLIENMSRFICPHCSGESHIFSNGRVKARALELKVPYLGDIPLDPSTREAGDAGMPIVQKNPESAVSAAFRTLAKSLMREVDAVKATAPTFTSSLFASTLPQG